MLSSLTSYILKKGGKPPSKHTAYGMIFGLFILNVSYVSLRATLASRKEEEERIAEARARLVSGKGLRGEVYFDHPTNNTFNHDKNTKKKKKKGGEVD
jgi:hypothetical protein